MQAIYHASLDEITMSFIENLKKQFHNSKVDIVIRDIDETDYLNQSKKNRHYLEEAIAEVNDSKLIQKSPQELGLWLYLLLSKVVCKAEENQLIIISCKYHYDD